MKFIRRIIFTFILFCVWPFLMIVVLISTLIFNKDSLGELVIIIGYNLISKHKKENGIV